MLLILSYCYKKYCKWSSIKTFVDRSFTNRSNSCCWDITSIQCRIMWSHDLLTDGWMDGWMDWWVDGRMDRWLDGWTNGWVDGWKVNRMHGWTNDCMNEWKCDMCSQMWHLNIFNCVLMHAKTTAHTTCWPPSHTLNGGQLWFALKCGIININIIVIIIIITDLFRNREFIILQL